MRKTALLISPFFYPELISTGRYNTHLVYAMVEAGFSVEVIASHPLYPDWRVKPAHDQISGVRILRGGLGIIYPKSAVLRRLVLELWFAWHVFHSCMNKKNSYDVVLCIFPPVLFSLLPRSIFKASYFVGVIHDLQGIMAISHRSLVRKVISRISHILEKRAFQRCDLLVCLSNSMSAQVVDNYHIPISKTFISYPFPSIIDASNVDSSRNDLIEIFNPNYAHIVYSGALGEKQQPELLLQIFKAICERDQRVVCHFFSRGPIFESLATKVSTTLIDRIQFHDLVPDQCLAELYQRSTVQLIPQAEGTGSGAFPSKLPNLLVTGVYVFAICDLDSELSTIIKDSGCGLATNCRDPITLSEEILNFARYSTSEDPNKRKKRLSKYVSKNLNLRVLIEKISMECNSKSATPAHKN